MNDETLDHTISPEAAALLLTCFGLLGSSAASLLLRMALAAVGFGAAGVTQGSFAAWWQSTVGLVQKKSLFSMLQSIAMRQAGATTATYTVGSLVGVAASSASRYRMMVEICKWVDTEVAKSSNAGILIQTNAKAVEKFILAVEPAKRSGMQLLSHVEPAIEAARKFAFESVLEGAKKQGARSILVVTPALEAAKEHSAKLISETTPALAATKERAARWMSDAAPAIEMAKKYGADIAADPASAIQAAQKSGKTIISAWRRPLRSRL